MAIISAEQLRLKEQAKQNDLVMKVNKELNDAVDRGAHAVRFYTGMEDERQRRWLHNTLDDLGYKVNAFYHDDSRDGPIGYLEINW